MTTTIQSTRRWRLLAVAVIVVVVVVQVLRSETLRPLDDAAWSVAVHNRRWIWGMLTNLVSDATPTVGGGVALLIVAAVPALRLRRRTPLVVAAGALVLLAVVVAAGKKLLAQGQVAGPAGLLLPGPRFPSGPATTAIVVGGVAAFLLWGRLRPARYRGLVALVPVVVLANGAAEVFLGQHRLTDVLASWVAGLAIVVVVVAVAGPAVRAAAVRPELPVVPWLVHLVARAPLAGPFHRAHVRLLLRSGGRLGSRWVDGSRVLVLEVLGRRTGELRRVPVAYVEHPDGVVVIPAAAGRNVTPGWLLNLRAARTATVHVRGGPRAVTAVEAQGARREELWRFVVARCPAALEYERLAGRRLSVVLLRPVAARPAGMGG